MRILRISSDRTVLKNRLSLCIYAAATLVLGTKPLPVRAEQPRLIPQPREIETKTDSFEITPNLKIILPPPTSADDRFAARSLQQELKLVTGRRSPIVAAPPSTETRGIILGRFGQSAIRNLVRAGHLSAAGIGEQGYALDVDARRVLIVGKDSAGLFYGVQTARQLVVGTGRAAKIIGVRVRDWPALPYRGTQVDMSRGPVPRLSTLERIVRTIAEFKLNQLYMYIEDAFPLNGRPLVGLLTDNLSQDEWKQLVAYAAPYHVEIVPSTEACGHMHKVFRFEEYSGLAERPHGHVFAPPDPQALSFLDNMYAQMVPVFSSPIYHIGCDETFELGKGKSAALVQEKGVGQVYVDDLLRVHDLVRRHNKQVMFWGDIALENPELIKNLPQDLIVASWEYLAHPDYAKWLKPFEGTGMKVYVCPWVGNTNLIVPDYEEAAANIETFLTDGKKAGAVGTIITVWNDDGETLYGSNWWSIIYGAACAWEQGQTDVNDFDGKFDWAFYRNTDHRFVEATKKLGHINELLRSSGGGQIYEKGYGGADDPLFWHDPFSLIGQNDVLKALSVASKLRNDAEEAFSVFAGSPSRMLRNTDNFANLKFAALKLDALGMRYQFVREIAERYANALAHEHDKDQSFAQNELWEIQGTNGRLEDLRDYTSRLRELYRELWLSENLSTWLPNMLQLYDRNADLWQKQISNIAKIKIEFGQGKALPPLDSLGLLPVEAQK